MERITAGTKKLIFFTPLFSMTEQEIADAEKALSEKTGCSCILLDSYWDQREKPTQNSEKDYTLLKLNNAATSAELWAKLAAVLSLANVILLAAALLTR